MGSVITILYARCYEKDLGVETAPFLIPRTKSVRSDSNGRLYGVNDIYTVVDGESEQMLRTQTSTQPLTLKSFTLRETTYPLDTSTEIKDGPELDKIWDVSLHTL